MVQMNSSLVKERAVDQVYEEALDRFRYLFNEAQKTGLREPAAMTLATASREGRASVRTMVVRKFDNRGFAFFTNSRSRKGKDLAENPQAALCFFCQPLWEQVTIEGHVEVLDKEEADNWWASRPRDNQFAAWASNQSAPLESRELLERRLDKCHEQFVDGRVPRPPHWLGYRLVPERIEFWKTGWRRLHERECYQRGAQGWEKLLLNP